jgi:peroxiredoxin
MQLSIGSQAPDAVLLDENGNNTALKSLWENGPTLLTFLRHFG